MVGLINSTRLSMPFEIVKTMSWRLIFTRHINDCWLGGVIIHARTIIQGLPIEETLNKAYRKFLHDIDHLRRKSLYRAFRLKDNCKN
mgnify:CR=1 FL=1